jgi:hypothetical protein
LTGRVFQRTSLRGDTAFSLTEHFDRWTEAGVGFVFGYAATANLIEAAEKLTEQHWAPLKLPVDEPLFSVPRNLIKSFNLDLAAAGIEKEDERGRTVDLHALRHTFGTHLSKNGVAPRTAQAAMRHSSLDLTMNVYTDPTLLDVAGAIAALPDLSLDGRSTAGSERLNRRCQ